MLTPLQKGWKRKSGITSLVRSNSLQTLHFGGKITICTWKTALKGALSWSFFIQKVEVALVAEDEGRGLANNKSYYNNAHSMHVICLYSYEAWMSIFMNLKKLLKISIFSEFRENFLRCHLCLDLRLGVLMKYFLSSYLL